MALTYWVLSSPILTVAACRLLAEYLQHSRGSAVAEAVEQLAGPAVLRMIHTQHGAYVGCAVFAYGTAKDRKKAIKSMKGKPRAMDVLNWWIEPHVLQ